MADNDPTAEEWLPIAGYEGLYEVSDCGNVRSLPTIIREIRPFVRKGKILKPEIGRFGYCRVALYCDGRQSRQLIHRLVLVAFDRPPGQGEECNHKDFDKTNNRRSNLEWVTRSKNVRWTVEAGRANSPTGERHGGAKLSEEDVRTIRRRLRSGDRQRTVAAAYGVTQSIVSDIHRGVSWTHVT